MAPDESPAAIGGLRISVAYSPRAGEVDEVSLELPPGATVADALDASGLARRYPGVEQLPVGIWGSFCERDAALRDRDRVELYRPLKVDPKEARRLREKARLAARAKRP